MYLVSLLFLQYICNINVICITLLNEFAVKLLNIIQIAYILPK